jgi:site-specific recombinase XerD
MQEPNPFTFNSKEEYLSALKEYHDWMIEESNRQDEIIARIRKERAAKENKE